MGDIRFAEIAKSTVSTRLFASGESRLKVKNPAHFLLQHGQNGGLGEHLGKESVVPSGGKALVNRVQKHFVFRRTTEL
jgi:hypothetical protein